MRTLFLFCCISLMTLLFASCDSTTGSDTYDATWSPSGDSKNTPWKFPSGVEFVQVDRGFQFSATVNDLMLVDSQAVRYTFIPSIYRISNMSTAKSATISFRARIVSDPDSVPVLPSGKVVHQFGKVGGTVETSGDQRLITIKNVDSLLASNTVAFSIKPFTSDVTNTIALSVNPDSCSLMLRFRVALLWNPFTGTADTTVLPLPRTKKVTVEVSDIYMRVYGLSVLK
jgi:hypothetical protein